MIINLQQLKKLLNISTSEEYSQAQRGLQGTWGVFFWRQMVTKLVWVALSQMLQKYCYSCFSFLVVQNWNDSIKNLQMWVYYIPNSAGEFQNKNTWVPRRRGRDLW